MNIQLLTTIKTSTKDVALPKLVYTYTQQKGYMKKTHSMRD